MPEITDRIDLGTALTVLGAPKDDLPMAGCPTCEEPLVMTLEFPGAEFICVPCDHLYGFLSPKPLQWTEERQARHDELGAQYAEARLAREAARRQT